MNGRCNFDYSAHCARYDCMPAEAMDVPAETVQIPKVLMLLIISVTYMVQLAILSTLITILRHINLGGMTVYVSIPKAWLHMGEPKTKVKLANRKGR